MTCSALAGGGSARWSGTSKSLRMENQMEKKIENETETGVIGYVGPYIGVIKVRPQTLNPSLSIMGLAPFFCICGGPRIPKPKP